MSVRGSNLPKGVLALLRGIVCALSTMICEGARRPFLAEGSTAIRKVSMERNSVVTGKTVTEG